MSQTSVYCCECDLKDVSRCLAEIQDANYETYRVEVESCVVHGDKVLIFVRTEGDYPFMFNTRIGPWVK